MHAPLKPNKCGLTWVQGINKGGDCHLKKNKLSTVYLVGLLIMKIFFPLVMLVLMKVVVVMLRERSVDRR